jgi:hypothetical protein
MVVAQRQSPGSIQVYCLPNVVSSHDRLWQPESRFLRSVGPIAVVVDRDECDMSSTHPIDSGGCRDS